MAPASGENADLVLSATASRLVNHAVGVNGNPIALKQLAADPAHPFTAGKMEIKLQNVVTSGAHVRDVAHSTNFDHMLFDDSNQEAPGSELEGGFYLADYRVPLEWLIQIYTQVSPQKYFLQINAARPDGNAIDENDRSDATITIDPDIDDNTAVDIALANGTSTPSVNGGVEMRWELTEAQHTLLRPVDGNGAREHHTLGLTIAAASSVAPITYSDYDETHADAQDGEYYLPYGKAVGIKAPSAGAWYARLLRPNAIGTTARAKLVVGE